jgi:ABC-type dipeptide/oligopeptide/nickel transport system ATPase component
LTNKTVAPLLHVKDLSTYYFGFQGTRVVKAVDGVSFSLEAGETFGLVGESGCSKTTTCHSLVRLLSPSTRIVGGRIKLEGEDLVGKSSREMREIRGRRIATILQDPMASLDPLFSIYEQVAEPAYYHQSLQGQELVQRVKDLLTAVRIPSPAARMKEFPHQMSGGMRQRIVGAIAQAGGPQIIIADEPTTNLDVTIQLQYLNLLKDLQRASGMALIFVAHDLGIVAKMCETVAVMYAGRSSSCSPSAGCSTIPSTPIPKRCWTPSPSWAPRRRCILSPASRRTFRPSLRTVSTRGAPAPWRAAPARSPSWSRFPPGTR